MRAVGGGMPMGSGGGATSAIKRIQRELKEICESPSRHWTAGPMGDDLFEWQFAVRGPPATDFEGGIYTGRLVLPVNYPLAPPSITLLTPNGRWEVGKKICLSNTSYHPDLWQPAWGIRTMMEALRSHFPVPGDGAIGSVDWPSDFRRKLAKESLDFISAPFNQRNRDLLPELTPEELQEDQPEPVPPDLRAPVLVDPALGPSAETDEGGKKQSGEQQDPLASGEGPAVAAGATPDHTARTPLEDSSLGGATTQTSASPAPNGIDGASLACCGHSAPSTAMPAGAAAGNSSSAPTTRRRRDGQRAQRRPQQSVLVQLFKPPTNGRGWVLVVNDILTFVMLASFFLVLIDMLNDPPTLLNPPVEQ